ncbi:MAG TPA: hypothetical protein PKA06_02255, partial [Gemmatales bacterium]|nr:hypothetical protein [Gemmatales bacterium]
PEVPVVLGGGLFQYFPSYGDFIISELKRCLRTEDNRCPFGKICTVTEPAEGAVKMAWKEILRTRS